jgi:hypothetical protein
MGQSINPFVQMGDRPPFFSKHDGIPFRADCIGDAQKIGGVHIYLFSFGFQGIQLA